MPKTKIPKHGAFNNSTKKKYCSICSTWVHSSQWKKHLHCENADLEEAQQGWMPREKIPEEKQISALEEENSKLKSESYKVHREIVNLRHVICHLGRLLSELYEY